MLRWFGYLVLGSFGSGELYKLFGLGDILLIIYISFFNDKEVCVFKRWF